MIIRIFDENQDVDDFLELFRISYGKPISRKYFEWKYIKNPIKINIHPIVVAVENDRLIGAHGQVFGRMMMKGNMIYSALGADLMVHPDFRGRGIHGMMHQFEKELCKAHQYEICYSFDNKISVRGDIRAGRKPIYNSISYWKILNAHEVFNKVLKHLVFRKACVLLSPLLWYKIRIPKLRNQNVTINVVNDVEILEGVYNEWRKSDNIHIVRDGKYLSWRFKSHPEIEYLFLAAYVGQEIKGYFVISMTELMGMKRGTIVDYLVVDDNANIFEPLLNYSLQMFEASHCALVDTWVFTQKWAQQVVKDYGFLSSQNIFLRRWVPNTYLAAKPLDEENFPYDLASIEWYITPSDSDDN